MIRTLKKVELRLATDESRGNVQTFLDRVIVEVLAENYRYFLSEVMHFDSNASYCWPPLMSNERQVAGIFATAVSRVCPLTLPEFSITRSARKGKSNRELAAGRVDFWARYGKRDVALELKRSTVSTLRSAKDNSGLKGQWEDVSRQSKQALTYMRDCGGEYRYPVSIGLLVVRVRRKVPMNKSPQDAARSAADALPDIADDVLRATGADYLAYATLPNEMQVASWMSGDKSQHAVFPGFAFAAVVHGQRERL